MIDHADEAARVACAEKMEVVRRDLARGHVVDAHEAEDVLFELRELAREAAGLVEPARHVDEIEVRRLGRQRQPRQHKPCA